MSKHLLKKQASLEKLLALRVEADHEIDKLWQEIRMLRIAAIRGDDDPGELPALLGLDEMKRAGQAKTETRERANHAIEMSPEYQRGLREVNSAA